MARRNLRGLIITGAVVLVIGALIVFALMPSPLPVEQSACAADRWKSPLIRKAKREFTIASCCRLRLSGVSSA